MEGGTTFHFLDASPAEALETAREAAGGQDVRLGGGPTMIRDFLAAGLVDHMHVVVVPILLGRGVRLWDGLEGLEKDYEVEATSVAQRRHPRDLHSCGCLNAHPSRRVAQSRGDTPSEPRGRATRRSIDYCFADQVSSPLSQVSEHRAGQRRGPWRSSARCPRSSSSSR